MLKLLFLLLFINIISYVSAQYDTATYYTSNIYDFKHSLEYAEFLELIHALSICYIKTNQKEIAIREIELLFPDPNLMHRKNKLDYSKLCLLNNDFDKAFIFSNQHVNNSENKQYIELYGYILQSRWSDAELYYSKINNENYKNEYELIRRGLNQKRRSPFLAGMFSAIMPGSGKYYTGEWKDGILGTIMIGGLAWQAYRAFNKKGTESAYGWITASIGFGFYIGNIYGSAKSAKRFNKNKNDEILNDAKKIFITDF